MVGQSATLSGFGGRPRCYINYGSSHNWSMSCSRFSQVRSLLDAWLGQAYQLVSLCFLLDDIQVVSEE